MTTTNKLDLRTCDHAALCGWVARTFPDLRIPAPFLSFYEWHKASPLDAVAAVERKAREGRLKGWDSETSVEKDGAHAWWWDGKAWRANASAPTEPEARLRAVALAFEAAGKD